MIFSVMLGMFKIFNLIDFVYKFGFVWKIMVYYLVGIGKLIGGLCVMYV